MKGQAFGNYVVRDKIGEGGMGEVFLAEHRHMGRKAAVKVLHAHGCANPSDVQRFFNEARAASIIDHPGVVQIFDCDVRDNVAYLIMEYLEGESLAALLHRTRGLARESDSIRLIGTQIASVLAAAHAKGIVHRDLKPDNVFLETRVAGRLPFQVRILDFGIAKLVAPDVPGLTKSGTVLGTPTYMAPEQCAGDRDVDTRADIYALGCILFEMAAGVPPFVRAGAGSLITAHMSEEPPSVDRAWPAAPVAFVSLVAQMLGKQPAGRPQTMVEVEARLHACLSAATSASPLPAPTVDTPLAATVSLATAKQPIVETQIDSQALVASVPMVSAVSEDSFPGPTESLPTGKRPPLRERLRDTLGVRAGGRWGALINRLDRKIVALLVVAPAVAIGLAVALVGSGRRPATATPPRSSHPAETFSLPAAAPPSRASAIPEPSVAPSSPPREEPPAPPPSANRPPSEMTGPSAGSLGAAAPDRAAPSPPSMPAASASPRREKASTVKSRPPSSRKVVHPQAIKEIRGFSDF